MASTLGCRWVVRWARQPGIKGAGELLEDRLAHEKLPSRFDLLPISCSNTRLVAGVNATSQRQAPGCALFFLKDHPRRERCNPACGNRVRAARAYRKRTNPAIV
jgi:predicted RNA-binding Zn ribbon-like protein